MRHVLRPRVLLLLAILGPNLMVAGRTGGILAAADLDEGLDVLNFARNRGDCVEECLSESQWSL